MSRPGQPTAGYPGTGPFDAKRGPGRPAGRSVVMATAFTMLFWRPTSLDWKSTNAGYSMHHRPPGYQKIGTCIKMAMVLSCSKVAMQARGHPVSRP